MDSPHGGGDRALDPIVGWGGCVAAVGAAEDGAEEALPARAHQHRDAQIDEHVEVAQQPEVVLERLAEPDAGVDPHLVDTRRSGRVDPGREDYTTRNTPKVMGGVTPACVEAAAEVDHDCVGVLRERGLE